MTFLTVSSCRTLEDHLHDIDLCLIKKQQIKTVFNNEKESINNILCYKYRYWKYNGETIGEPFELEQLPEVVYFVDGPNFEKLLEDRNRAALFRKNNRCRPKR